MASLKALKMRIASVKSTQKITRAMKLVAASKLRRAQAAAEAARPYAERMEAVLASLGASVVPTPQTSTLLTGTGRQQTYMLVVATSERGLAGGFNTNIVRAARRRIDELLADGKTVKLLLVGKKGRAQLARTHKERILETVDLTAVKRLAFTDAQGIATNLLDRYAGGEFDVAELFFARFVSVLAQEPTLRPLIPVPLPTGGGVAGPPTEYEPDEDSILTELLPRNVAVQIYRALLENAASEQGARMTAMDNATRNAGDMIKLLSLVYNRTRQAVITKELIEIISGAEAL